MDVQVGTEPSTASLAKLNELIAQATAKYAVKEYIEAADLYSEATEIQAEINGELSPLNADLLYCYGRCLYHVALLSSDVLGTKVTQEARAAKSAGTGQTMTPNETKAASGKQEQWEADGQPAGSTATFQFLGDEEDEEEEDEEGAAGEQDNGEDEFSNAFEILDLARVLLLKRLEEIPKQEAACANADDSPRRQLQERLADTYDLQAEISLENERFSDAAKDLRETLDLKSRLYPPESSEMAEAHYKLALALEFAALPPIRNENGELKGEGRKGEESKQEEPATADEGLRKEAAEHMQSAISSCKLRISKEEDALNGPPKAGATPDEAEKVRKVIDDVKGMIEEMQLKLHELRQPYKPTDIADGGADATALRGVFETMLGKSPEAQRAGLAKVAEEATDVSSLIKKKPVNGSAEKPKSEENAAKRKAGADGSSDHASTAKKIKADDGLPGIPKP